MNRTTHPRRAALLATLLAASAGVQCARDSSPGSCVTVSCAPRPSTAPAYPAAVFGDCEAIQPGLSPPPPSASAPPRPPHWNVLSIGRTRDARRDGQPTACCYESPGMCGVGRPLRVGGRATVATIGRGGWG